MPAATRQNGDGYGIHRDDAAISEIVKKYDIGYCIDNLYEINNIDESQYFIKRNNIINLSEKV